MGTGSEVPREHGGAAHLALLALRASVPSNWLGHKELKYEWLSSAGPEPMAEKGILTRLEMAPKPVERTATPTADSVLQVACSPISDQALIEVRYSKLSRILEDFRGYTVASGSPVSAFSIRVSGVESS